MSTSITSMVLCLCALTSSNLFTHALQNGEVRLVCGESKNKGTVQVYYDGQWGTICDTRWGSSNANVVCRQLGYERALRLHYNSHFCKLNNTVPIHVDGLYCQGLEQSILECSHNGWGVHTCSHDRDAGVECKRKTPQKPHYMPVRLACPDNTQDGTCTDCPHKQYPDPEDCTAQVAVQGIVMALYNNEWKPVTAEGWNMRSAHVVCGELGYPLALGIPTLEQLWSNWNGEFCKPEIIGSGDTSDLNMCSPEEITANDEFRDLLSNMFLDDLECIGKERRLLDCYFPGFGPYSNPSLNVATVRCGYQAHQSCNPFSQEEYRTRGNSVPWKGRVEVNVAGEWGTVCDNQWSFENANVVCRAMGYGTAKYIFFRGFFGRGVGPIHYSNLKCAGNELHLLECEGDTGYLAELCGHQGDAGVECNAPLQCEPPTMGRLVTLPDPLYPWYEYQFVEVHGPLGWGQMCVEDLNLAVANVICRENKRMFVANVKTARFQRHRPGYSGIRYSGKLLCTGDEIMLEDCRIFPQPTETCREGDAVLDCTDRLPDLVPHLDEFEYSLRAYTYLTRWPMFSLQCALEENCLSSSADQYAGQYDHYRTLLAFSSLTMNYGTVDFYPTLQPHEWIYHTCHHHYHSFETFVNYDLLNVSTEEKVAEGHKASFCLEDTNCEDGYHRRFRCGIGYQGISANCGDLYARNLDCQWIDITDVPPGTYILRQHVNPDKLVMESDFTNNVVQCVVTVSGPPAFRYSVGECERKVTS